MWAKIFGFFRRKKPLKKSGMLRTESLAVLQPKMDLIISSNYAYTSHQKSSSFASTDFEKLRGLKIVRIPDKFNLKNGLVNLMEKLFFEFVKIVGDEDDKLASLVGVSREFYDFILDPQFAKNRSIIKCHVSYLPNLFEGNYVLDGMNVTFNCFESQNDCSLFFDKLITRGIIELRVKVNYNGRYGLFLGCILPSQLNQYLQKCIGMKMDSAAFGFFSRGALVFYSGWRSDNIVNGAYGVKDGSVITAVLDMGRHEMHFFVDGILVPYTITNIPSKTYLGFSCNGGNHTVTFLSMVIRSTSYIVLSTHWPCFDFFGCIEKGYSASAPAYAPPIDSNGMSRERREDDIRKGKKEEGSDGGGVDDERVRRNSF